MTKSKSPFKDNSLLKQQIQQFLTKYHAQFAQEASRTSSFFELAAYNDLVKFYETNGYFVAPQNLKGKTQQFVYALSPKAKPENCSYFLAEKNYKSGASFTFEIRHNLRVQSAHDPEIFVSPDYSVIEKNAVTSTRLSHYYNGKIDYFYVAAKDVKTFAETKHYAPSPELVLNFVGLINELMPGLMAGQFPTKKPMHCGPSLFISGVGNVHLGKIKDSLGIRYSANILMGLFAYPSQVHSASNQVNILKIGSAP